MEREAVAKSAIVSAPLPGFDATGYLPVGIHACTMDELARVTRFNEHRRKMWRQLASFLAWPVLANKFVHAFIGGGFISTKMEPNDIDVVLEAANPYGPEAFASVAGFFVVGLERIQRLYGVHLQFWMQGAPSGLSDYRVFFQYDRPGEITPVPNRSRGVVRLDLAEPGLPDILRRHMREEDAGTSTDFLRAEAAKLQGPKKHFALMGMDASQVTIVTDPEGHIEWVNKAFSKTCGFTLEEVRGKKPGRVLQGPGSDAVTIRTLRQAVGAGRSCDCRIVNYRKDGTPYLVHISLEPLFGRSGLEGFVALEEELGPVASMAVHDD